MPEIKPFDPIQTIKQNTGTAPSIGSQIMSVPDVPRETVETKSEEPKEKVLDSERFAALTKKEKLIQRRARELQEREQRISKWEDAEKLVGSNKLEALKRLGISYDELTNLHLSQMGADEQTPEAIAARKAQEVARAELELYKEEQKQKEAELQQRNYQAALQQFEVQARELTKSRPDDFPYIAAEDAHLVVVDFIENVFHNGLGEEIPAGTILSVENAAAEVEKYLESKYEKISQVPKFRSKYLNPQVGIEKPSESRISENTQKPQTLTHKTTVAPPAPRVYSAAERKERAIRILSGQPVD